MSDLLAHKTNYTIVDPLHHDDFQTSEGTLRADEGGYIRLPGDARGRALAQEIQQREPWALVTEHEQIAAGKRLRPEAVFVNGLGNKPKTDAEWEADGWVRDGTHWIKRSN
jgi:hypothetical protein